MSDIAQKKRFTKAHYKFAYMKGNVEILDRIRKFQSLTRAFVGFAVRKTELSPLYQYSLKELQYNRSP